MEYFVVGPNGQKFGPAGIPILNQWIQEGRIVPQTLLQEAATGAQIIAGALPGLSFTVQPPLAPPGANPYLMQNPAHHPTFYAQNSQPWNQPTSMNTGQVVGAWVCTLLAPIFLVFCYVGLAGALFGLITGVQLYKEGSKGGGATLVGLNSFWLLAYLGFRIWLAF